MGKTSWQVKQKYNQKAYDRIYLSVPKGLKDEYKEIAEKEGKSLNQFINDCIEEYLKSR